MQMKGANKIKKFNNQMKSYTQALGIQNTENDEEKAKKEIKKKKFFNTINMRMK